VAPFGVKNLLVMGLISTVVITEATGIQIFEASDFEVRVNDKDFTLWQNGKKIMYFSNREWLSNLNFCVKQVASIAFNRGHAKGREQLQKDIKNLLSI
jgi:hypothetical protein